MSLGRRIAASILHWLPLAILTVCVSGMIYVTVQQGYRNAANDPQLEMATDAVAALQNGADPASVIPSNTIDLAQDLAPFLAVYDTNGHLLASSATLHGQSLDPAAGILPTGIFARAKATPPDIVTWQAATGERTALVVLPYKSGFIIGGRSLRPTEDREDQLLAQVVAGCLVTLVATYLTMLATQFVAAWQRGTRDGAGR